ncbi:hypothetical protein J2T09_005557 [Neorhizobium huautlense]|uniref:Uncharacterized protein n=1 Tax=Neorhizobium huautlense TaxID=67774 RepID=A0ABT9Q3U7_9HYPH|nr:hypothetical protein [Neorhizobium huautlense]MDP9840769.1 hypothetical protein [Neorhizobium huautlense]
MPNGWQKKYDRRITWPGEGHEDWSGYDGEIYIGRITRDLTTHGKTVHSCGLAALTANTASRNG